MSERSMSRKIKLIAASVLLPLGIIVPLLASGQSQINSTLVSALSSPQEQRVANYKKQLKRKVQQSEADRIKLHCSVAQSNAQNISDKVTKTRKQRQVAYKNILSRLNKLLAKLNAQAFETTNLEEDINTLSIKINDFNTHVDGYLHAINDVATVDCSKDPVAFIAALKAAREHHDKLVVLVGDIRVYITNNVKPNLVKIRQQIENGQTVGGGE